MVVKYKIAFKQIFNFKEKNSKALIKLYLRFCVFNTINSFNFNYVVTLKQIPYTKKLFHLRLDQSIHENGRHILYSNV